MKIMDNSDNFSNWAKFCFQTKGYRFFENGKPISKHRLFRIVEGKFDLNNYDLQADNGKILDYLQGKFKWLDADGWSNGVCQVRVVRDNLGVITYV